MTPIDGLVKVACGMTDGPLHESSAVMQGAMASARALRDSFIAMLGDAAPYDFFRAEFRVPSEPQDPRQGPEGIPQPPVSVDVNVNAVVRQIREALGDIQAGSVNVPAVYSSYAFTGLSQDLSASKNSSDAKRWPELAGIPVPDASFSKEYSKELARGGISGLSREVTKEQVKEIVREPRANVSTLPRQGAGGGRMPGGLWYRGRGDKPEKLAEKHYATADPREAHGEPGPAKPASPSQAIDQNIKRSTLVINQLENVVRNIVSTESIVKEVKQSSSAVEQLRSIRVAVLDPRPSMPTAQAPTETTTFIPGMPQRQPEPRQGMQPQVDKLTVAQSGPAHEARAPSGLHRVKADSEANARGLSDALSRSISMPGGPGIVRAPEVEIPPMRGISASPVAHVSRAMAAIADVFHVAGNYAGQGSPRAPIVRLHMAGSGGTTPGTLNVGRSIEALSRTGQGVSAQSPIVSLINNVAVPQASAAPVDVLVRMSDPAPPGLTQQAHHPNPVINLAVSMAAAQAAQKAGTSVIRDFVRASPSTRGNFNAQALADRNVVNVSMPGVTVERETSGNVGRNSTFHNTFNISITMKGGGEESDMKELGKKIGRILSDEIKRYGGA